MSKERLEESIRAVKSNWPDEKYSLLRDALDYIISEAERVQELESDVNRLNEALHFQLTEEIKRNEKIRQLEQQNKRYREALEWYSENSPHGNIADEALEGESE